ncbi:MAG: hypothetical protein AAF483_11370 [Planctomycetota bacterium]
MAATLAWSISQYLPPYQTWVAAQWEREMEQALGFDVDVLSAENYAPYRTRLHGVRLRDRENRVTIATAEYLDVDRGGSKDVVVAHQVQLEGPRLPDAWRFLHDSYLCVPADRDRNIDLRLDSVEIHREGESQKFAGQALIVPSQQETKVNLKLTLQHESQQPSEPVSVFATRVHDSDSKTTRIDLQTGATPLPCSLLRALVPATSNLGDRARLLGSLRCELNPKGWSVRIGSPNRRNPALIIYDVDYSRLTWNAPEIVAGNGWISLCSLEMHQDAFSKASGVIGVQSGEIDRRFLQNLQRMTGSWLRPDLAAAQAGTEGFGAFSLWFHLNVPEQYLELQGGIGDQGIMLTNREGEAIAACTQSVALGRFRESWAATNPMANRGLVQGIDQHRNTRQFYPRPLEAVVNRWLQPEPLTSSAATALNPQPELSNTRR